MKRTVSLLLATLMIVALVPVFAFTAAAEGDESTPVTSTYVVYREDFDDLNTGATSDEILAALGWYVPTVKEADNIATYSVAVTENADESINKALHVSTVNPAGLESESFVTVFGGDIMSLVRNGDFELSYKLTYRAGTTNVNGYSTLVYNYNEKHGRYVSEGGGEAYGIAAVRACGTGINGIYYPVSGGSELCYVESMMNTAEQTMGNRYTSTGSYPSLYARLFMTDPADESASTIRSEVAFEDAALGMLDKTVEIRVKYDYEAGPSVYVNGVEVSVPNTTDNWSDNYHNGVWNDFITRSTGAAVALVTKYGIEADIDDIEIKAENLADEGFAAELPELVISEMTSNPHDKQTIGGVSYATDWAEYIEIYNPTDHAINLAEYSIMQSDVSEGSIDDYALGRTRRQKFTQFLNLGDYLGKEVVSTNYFYLSAAQLKSFSSNGSRYQFVDADTTLTSGTYYKLENGAYQPYVDADGSAHANMEANQIIKKINYKELWNVRYTETATDKTRDTYIEPGECVMIYLIQDKIENCWKYGVNGGTTGVTQTSINAGCCFRQIWDNYGLIRDTMVVAVNAFNLANNPLGGGDFGARRYYIGKTYYDTDDAVNNPNGAEKVAINYKNVVVTDANHDQYIVSYVDWTPSLINGVIYEGTDPNNANFGQSGKIQNGYSGVWVYGVDASGDPRRGTLYTSINYTNKGSTNVTPSHAGKLSGAQEILFGDIYAKNNGAYAYLSITEIAPRTYTLAGDDLSAFTAIELTNTGSERIDLYRYALVRTGLDAECGPGDGFIYSTVMQAGNPVVKGVANGAYYYFTQNTISNPESCILSPGESVVVWFITDDTYTAYKTDEDFGFDYFRQYWVNQGVNQMGMKNAGGDYATKVIAVDGNASATTNGDNAGRVFSISDCGSAVYGVTVASNDVKQGTVATSEVLSAAFLGSSACYYNLEWGSAVADGVTYYGNILTRRMPANTTMRYVVGGAGSIKCSAMVDSMKVQYCYYPSSPKAGNWKSTEENTAPNIKFIGASAMQAPRLGSLDGEEVLPLLDRLFIAKVSDDAVTYRYFDELRSGVETLQGAALRTTGSSAVLRFDNVVSNNVYANLAATYGSDFEVGMLIVETALLGDKVVFTEADLLNAGIGYAKVKSEFLYRTGEFSVLGSSFTVSSGNYATSYTAVGYMKVTLADGTVKTYWSGTTTARSVAQVAAAALADVSETKDDVYAYPSGEAFSRYSQAVQQKLRGYAGL